MNQILHRVSRLFVTCVKIEIGIGVVIAALVLGYAIATRTDRNDPVPAASAPTLLESRAPYV